MREPNRFQFTPRLADGDQTRLVGQSSMRKQLDSTTAPRCSLASVKYCQNLINTMTRKLHNTNNINKPKNSAHGTSGLYPSSRTTSMQLALVTLLSLSALQHALAGTSATINQSNLQQRNAEQLPAQARVGGLDPSDYVDEAGELDVLLGQQQIPTAQLMAAAGHVVPENFFLPGGSIPANILLQQQLLQQQQQQQQQSHSSQHQQQQQQLNQNQQQNHQDAMQQAAASQVHTRVVAAPSRFAGQTGRGQLAPLDLLMAAAEQHQAANDGQVAALIDQNGYAMTTQPDPRDAAAHMDLLDFLASPQALNNQQMAQLAALYDQQLAQQQHRHQQQQQQQNHHHQQQQQHHQNHHHHQQQQANLVEQMTALASELQQQQQHHSQQQEQTSGDNEHYMGTLVGQGSAIGPDYQLIPGDYSANSIYDGSNKGGQSGEQQYASASYNSNQQQQHRPYGLPTKSSNKEPPGMLKPLGNPKTVSSPIIDFAANNLPKNTGMEKLADKIPQHQTPTVFSFASSKDPSEKVKGVNQKKRTVMRQAEQIAKLMIKSFNDKFGTNLGDQTDIPFLLSSLGPLGFAQNILLDPTLLVSLLNTAEKTYLSDVLPGPAKQVVRPVLNFFRVPNKKRGDKANLSNIISYLASGGQTAANVPSKHRQALGIEKASLEKSKSRR